MPKAKAHRVQRHEERPALDAEAFLKSAAAALTTLLINEKGAMLQLLRD